MKKDRISSRCSRISKGRRDDRGVARSVDPGLQDAGLTLKSPIDHPECGGTRPRPVISRYSRCRRDMRSGLGFLESPRRQANFLRQARGFFPIVPIPPTWSSTTSVHFGAVFFTITLPHHVADLPGGERLVRRADSLDKIGILVAAEPKAIASLREIFTSHHALEISGSV